MSAPPNCQDGICSSGCGAGLYRSGGVCVGFTDCGPGTFVEQPGTAASDQVCSACPSGTFSSTTNAPTCDKWKVCDAGTFVSSVPSPMTDRQCTVCGAGTYAYGVNQISCTSDNECKAGTKQIAPATLNSPPVCAACNPGEYCAGRAAAAIACTGDSWDDDHDPATPCEHKTVCSPGSYVVAPGGAITDRACSPCLTGTFSLSANSMLCYPWSTCVAGTYVANSPSATVDRQCVACPADTYTAAENQSLCLAANDCPAGKVQTAPPTGTSAATCQACRAGQYCAGGKAPAINCPDDMWDHDNNPATACAAKSTCPAGMRVADAGSPTSDHICTPCDSGTFTATSNLAACAPWTDCLPGTYVAAPPTVTSDRQCLACTANTTTSTINETACSAVAGTCAPGTVLDANGQCQDCVPGEYCAGGGAAAAICSAGTFDKDGNPATPCVDKTTCHAPTEYVVDPGSPVTDRTCGYCLVPTTVDNQETCPIPPPPPPV